MTAIWEASWRSYPALLLALAGLMWIVATVRREAAGLRRPVTSHTKGVALLRAGRSVIGGLALCGLAAGWAWHLPFVFGLACIIGGEEMLEIAVVLAALDEAERSNRWGAEPV